MDGGYQDQHLTTCCRGDRPNVTFEKESQFDVSSWRGDRPFVTSRKGSQIDEDNTVPLSPHLCELQGVPIRVEVGPRDMKNSQYVAVRRNNMEKLIIKKSGLKDDIPVLLEIIRSSMFTKANIEITERRESVGFHQSLMTSLRFLRTDAYYRHIAVVLSGLTLLAIGIF